MACLLSQIAPAHAAPLELTITDAGFRPDGSFVARFQTDTNYYYRLLRGRIVTTVVNPRDLSLAPGDELELVDKEPDALGGFYRAQAIPLYAPIDSDNDGIDDIFEAQHPDVLDPLNGLDAELDPDGDGVNNRTAYRRLFGYLDTPPLFISRETSIFNFGQPTAIDESISREATLFNFGAPPSAVEAISHEVSVYNGSGPPLSDTILTSISRELTVYNFELPPHTIETISAEVSVYNGSGFPRTDINNVVSRELSVFNIGQPIASLEAISREVSVLNFIEPQ